MNRTVAVRLLDGTAVDVEEPAWCVVDHSGARLASLADLVHEGPEQALDVASLSGRHQLLAAALDEAPFSEFDRRTRVTVDLGGEYAGFDPQGLRDLAAGLVVHAGHLRDLAARLQQLLAGAGEAQ